MSKEISPKCKNMMYAQKVSHLPPGVKTKEDLANLIDTKLSPKEYAVIVHDQEIDDKGQPKEADMHAMLCFENARSVKSVAKALGDKPQYIQKWEGKRANGHAYLIHATDKAKREGKHQYDTSAVIANFDYGALMAKIIAEIAQARAEHTGDVKSLLDKLYIGAVTKADIEKQLSGSQYARYHRQIEDVDAKRLLRQAEEWRAEMRKKGAKIDVIWITGPAGTGKTSLAKEYASKKDQPYYITGSSRDIFQNYNGEHTLIIDELRPKMITYSDLLRITDPHGIDSQVMLPCRYHDKALACDLIIITTPFTPSMFYYQQFGSTSRYQRRDDCPDGIDQLLRRITVTIEMTGEKIEVSQYNIGADLFVPNPNTARPNPYSRLARPAPSKSEIEFFNSMFDD